MTKFRLSGLHVITDSTSSVSLVDQAICAASNGASVVQLRDKFLPDSDLVNVSKDILEAIKKYDCYLIINDRVEVALEAKAHGVHIGQGDGNPIDVRNILSENMILGLSIRNLDDLKRSHLEVVDYAGVGPIRATSSKADHSCPIGFDGLKEINDLLSCPSIAIGGLFLDDIPLLKHSGTSGLAVIGAVSKSDNPGKSVQAMAKLWGSDDC